MTSTRDTADEPVARLAHPRAIRWLHWVDFPLLFLMIWSGLRIYWAEDVYAFGIGSWQWFAFFPDEIYTTFDLERRLAHGIAFHFTIGWLFVANGVVYAGYLVATGAWRTIVPERGTVREAGRVVRDELRLRRRRPPAATVGDYNPAQRLAYTAVLIMAFVTVVSGFAIYKPTQLHPLPLLFGGYQGARLVHFSMTIGMSVFFLVHVAAVARAGWNAFQSMVTGYVVDRPGEGAGGEVAVDADDGELHRNPTPPRERTEEVVR